MAKEIELLTARADALFTSDLSARCCHSEAEIAAAIMRAIRSHSAVGGLGQPPSVSLLQRDRSSCGP